MFFSLWPVLEESECSWPSAEMMVRELVVAKMTDHQSRHHHHYPGLAVKENPQEPLYSQ
jgi:hypothetical protein